MGSSAGKAKEKLRKAMLHLSKNTKIMQFYLTELIRGFPHPLPHKPVGQIKASEAHPFPSGTEESRGVAVLTQKERGKKQGQGWIQLVEHCRALLLPAYCSMGAREAQELRCPPLPLQNLLWWQLSSPAFNHIIPPKFPLFLLQVFPPDKQESF